jgi:CheY-like chemotaxis protein
MKPPYPGEDHRLWEAAEAAGIPENPDGRRILVVEDDAPIREVLITTLRLSGYRVAAAADGREAFDVAVGFRPELVLMDLMLPDVDGWAVTQRIASEPRLHNPPVIVLSARVREVDRQRAFDAGAVHFLPKPCRASDLLQAIKSFMPEMEDGREDPSGLVSLPVSDLDETDSSASLTSIEFEIDVE